MKTRTSNFADPVRLLAALCFCFVSCYAAAQQSSAQQNPAQQNPAYDMEQVKDVALLELKVLKEWHPVATTPPTQQKIVDVVRRLEDAGEIIISGRGGEKELVV